MDYMIQTISDLLILWLSLTDSLFHYYLIVVVKFFLINHVSKETTTKSLLYILYI